MNRSANSVLRDLLCSQFNLEDLQNLCFDLNIKYENLSGTTLDGKARELILYCHHRGQLPLLLARCQDLRPNGNWLAFDLPDEQYGTVVAPNHGDNLLFKIWDNLAPDLQDALALAYNQAQRDGRNTIKTRYLFAALNRLQPEPMPAFMEHVPIEAMPKPLSATLSTERTLLQGNPQLSHCVHESLTELGHHASASHKLSTADVFVDIAKHGTGSSVRRLRTYDVTPERVDEIVRQLGWEVINR